MLAALPFAGTFIPAAYATNADQVFAKKLVAVRDLLLPALYCQRAENPDLDFDITVDRGCKSLLVTGRNRNTNHELGFAITKESIVDGHYKTSFRPSMLHLARMLHQPSAVHNEGA